uniref:Eukaryotic translation initiation factor 4B3 n=1 Tax=Ananas comosus var. bracteatus TaxID=296719 RepID=A0A6V7QMX1_ANACO|nr:unnamed protein product [Ananas comosus var. bracteatus]
MVSTLWDTLWVPKVFSVSFRKFQQDFGIGKENRLLKVQVMFRSIFRVAGCSSTLSPPCSRSFNPSNDHGGGLGVDYETWGLGLDAEADDAAAAAADSAAAADFPTLAAAAASKAPKKKPKAQPLSLAEFTTLSSASSSSSSSSKGLTPDELLRLPTGPRERSAEELERSSTRGFGYSSYNLGGGGGGRGRNPGEESSNPRWGSSRVSDDPKRGGSSRDLGPSRADEVDDWGAGRSRELDLDKSLVPPPSDARRIGGRGFDGPRERRGPGGGGFDVFNSVPGSDAETWGKKKEEGNGPDAETWGKKREEGNSGSSGRPRLVLQPRSLPLANGSNGSRKGSNPFGEARPREQVLAEKGQDWKEIDEKLEAMKVGEGPHERAPFGKKGFGAGNGIVTSTEDRTERAWRKADTVEAPPASSETVDESVPEN